MDQNGLCFFACPISHRLVHRRTAARHPWLAILLARMEVKASADSSDFVLLDLPMTLLTRDGKQLDLFIKLTTLFVFPNKKIQKSTNIEWYRKNLASICKELEMLLHLRKRLELIDDQAPDSTEWAEYFDGYINGSGS